MIQIIEARLAIQHYLCPFLPDQGRGVCADPEDAGVEVEYPEVTTVLITNL